MCNRCICYPVPTPYVTQFPHLMCDESYIQYMHVPGLLFLYIHIKLIVFTGFGKVVLLCADVFSLEVFN